MAKENGGVHIHIGQLPRYSRPVRIYLNDSTDHMEPVNVWNYNLNVIKEQKIKEEKLLQK